MDGSQRRVVACAGCDGSGQSLIANEAYQKSRNLNKCRQVFAPPVMVGDVKLPLEVIAANTENW